MIDITLEKLRRFAPACPVERAEIIGGVLRGEAASYQVETLARLHHFLAQIAHESAGFTRLEEGLSYSAARLMQVWPSRFKTLNEARPYERQPYALAEKVYGDRMGNRAPGDGWRYRGRGLIQITGRENYERFGKIAALPLLDNPGIAADADEATRIALAYWRETGCNLLADVNDIQGITRKINGGLHGVEERAVWLAKARKVFR